MNRIIKALAIGALLAVAACARTGPIYNIADAPVSTASGKALPASQVRAAIIAAGTSLGWRIADAGPNQLEGTLVLRTHTAVVDIAYTATTYAIQYKRSENLYASGQTIHSNYNGWIQNLDRAIRTELSRL